MLEDKLFDLEGTLPDSLIKSLWMIDDFCGTEISNLMMLKETISRKHEGEWKT